MSGLAICWPKSLAGPLTTARCGSHRRTRAPIDTSLSTKNRRFSNIFSKIRTIPSDWVAIARAMLVRSAGKAGHGPSSIFEIASPSSSRTRRRWPAGTITSSPSNSIWQPSRSNTRRVMRRSAGTVSRTRSSPAVTADHVPARRGHLGAAEAGQQRPGDEERGADPVRDLGVDLRLAHVRRAEGDDVLVAPVDAHAEPAQELEHRLHVADARDVAEDDLLLGQEACRERRQRRVLVTRRHDRARQRLTPLDDELLHEPCRDT